MCHFSGCTFSAATPKVVQGHYQSAHGKFSMNGGSGSNGSSGGFKTITVAIPGVPVQRFRICVGNRPQDVQEWIQERRLRFPRTSRVAAVAVAASAVVTTKEPNAAHAENIKPATPPPCMTTELSTLLQGYGSSSEEEDDNHSDSKNMETSKTSDINTSSKQEEADSRMDVTGTLDVAHGAAAAVSAVGQHAMTGATTTITSEIKKKIKNPCHAFMRHGRCHRGDACPYRHDNLPSSAEEQQQQQQQQQAASSADYNNNNKPTHAHVPAAPPRNNNNNNNKRPKLTLLEKLLTKDVERETTLTLQLLEYIARSNFLQCNQTDKAAAAAAASPPSGLR
jgi:Zinc finger C-x8-C-x5-C-x3-H type (and similar)